MISKIDVFHIFYDICRILSTAKQSISNKIASQTAHVMTYSRMAVWTFKFESISKILWKFTEDRSLSYSLRQKTVVWIMVWRPKWYWTSVCQITY